MSGHRHLIPWHVVPHCRRSGKLRIRGTKWPAQLKNYTVAGSKYVNCQLPHARGGQVVSRLL